MWINNYNYWFTQSEIESLLFVKDKRIAELEKELAELKAKLSEDKRDD